MNTLESMLESTLELVPSFALENPAVIVLIVCTMLAVYFTAKIVLAILDYYWGV